MSLVQRWIDTVYLWLEKLKGASVVRQHYRTGDLCEQLTGYSVSGYEIRLYCQQMRYVRQYLRWMFPRQTYCTFRVFGRVSQDAPKSLKKACELEIDLPRMLPSCLSEEAHKEAAIQAYLDILISNIQDSPSAFHSAV